MDIPLSLASSVSYRIVMARRFSGKLTSGEMEAFSQVLVCLAKDKKDLCQVATSRTMRYLISGVGSGDMLTFWGRPLFAEHVLLTGMDTPSSSASSWRDGLIPGGAALVGLLEQLGDMGTIVPFAVYHPHTVPTDHSRLPNIAVPLFTPESSGPVSQRRSGPAKVKQADSHRDRQEDQQANQQVLNQAGEQAVEDVSEQPIFFFEFSEKVGDRVRYLTVIKVEKCMAIQRHATR